MRDSEIRRSETVVRMDGFGDECVSDFPPTSLGGQKFAELKTIRIEIDQLGAQQSEGHGAAKTSTEEKRVARQRVRSLLRAISNTSEAMEATRPGISNTFRMPKTNGDEALINFARAVMVAAVPLKNEFLLYELHADFLKDLTEAVDTFEEATGSRNLNTRKRISATAALRDALERSMQIRRELDPIVRNKYRDNPAKLAAWESASRVERAPRKKQQPPTSSQS